MNNRMKADRTLLQQIIAIHEKSHQTYGSPRVCKTLKKQGVVCGENRIARLMHSAHLKGRVVTVTRRAPGVQRFYERHANLRLAKPAPATMNQQWVADVTFLRVQGQQCFLAAIMDVYSRKILGWSLGKDRTMRLTTRAFTHALKDRRPAPGCIFHSDRGVEYGGAAYVTRLKRQGFLVSMNRSYHSQDNAHMESFFHTMKAEWNGVDPLKASIICTLPYAPTCSSIIAGDYTPALTTILLWSMKEEWGEAVSTFSGEDHRA